MVTEGDSGEHPNMPRPSRLTSLLTALAESGGVTTSATLIGASSRSAMRAALAEGFVHALGRGTYAMADIATLPPVPNPGEARSWARWTQPLTDDELKRLVGRHARATAAHAALCQLSAASHHGWPLLREPRRLEVVLPRGRHVPKSLEGCHVRYLVVDDGTFVDGVTTPLQTVLQCAAALPFPEALAVADSALRSGTVGADSLRNAADLYLGRARNRVRRVAEAADGRAANPFESGLRAILLETSDIELTVQHEISDDDFSGVVDLADERLRMVIEADSYEFHGSPERFARDIDRYDDLACRDWLVLRFRLHHVLHDPRRIQRVVRASAQVRRRRGYGEA